jgi:hypothetical protein
VVLHDGVLDEGNLAAPAHLLEPDHQTIVGTSCQAGLRRLYFCYWLVDNDNGRARRGGTGLVNAPLRS